MSRHSVPHFPPNSSGNACLVAELNAASPRVSMQLNTNINQDTMPKFQSTYNFLYRQIISTHYETFRTFIYILHILSKEYCFWQKMYINKLKQPSPFYFIYRVVQMELVSKDFSFVSEFLLQYRLQLAFQLTLQRLYVFCFFFSLTLNPAYSAGGRGNLVLRYSVIHFPPKFLRYYVLSDGSKVKFIK